MRYSLVFAISIAAFIGFFSVLAGASTPNSNAASNATARRPPENSRGEVRRAPANAGAPRVARRIIKERSPARKLDISARYPQISGVPSAAAFNSLAEKLVRRHIADFKRNVGAPDRGSRDRSLEIGYQVSLVDNDLISVGFGAATDTGGIHPNAYSFVLNYDLNNQRVLSLGDLFRPNSGYLQAISGYCIRQLRGKVSDYETLVDGASPTPGNYDSWLISRKGLSITFDAYQVASYAEGPQNVAVPFSVIRSLIRPQGPISHLLESPVRPRPL